MCGAILERLTAAISADFGETLFSDGPTVDELVARALDDRGWTVAVGESCTGGLLTARLTAPAGSSGRVLGGVAAYANSAKERLLAVLSDQPIDVAVLMQGLMPPDYSRMPPPPAAPPVHAPEPVPEFEPEPRRLRTRTATTVVPGTTPTTPMAFFTAAIVPAT